MTTNLPCHGPVPYLDVTEPKCSRHLTTPFEKIHAGKLKLKSIICNWMYTRTHIYIYTLIYTYTHTHIYIYIYIPVVPHKAVAEVSKIGNLWERLVVVHHRWQSEATDGPKGG